jgi:hypothetical protein
LTGNLIDNLCPGAEGKICLIYFSNNSIVNEWQASYYAERSGCVGVIAFKNDYDSWPENHRTELLIPFVYIGEEQGKILFNGKIGSNAAVQVKVFGASCYPTWGSDTCNAKWPCEENSFCRYNSVPIGQDLYEDGWCESCPIDANGDPNPLACYIDDQLHLQFNDTWTDYDTVQNVDSCAKSCGAEVALMVLANHANSVQVTLPSLNLVWTVKKTSAYFALKRTCNSRTESYHCLAIISRVIR